MTDRNILDLCPELLTLYRQWLMECHAAGLAVKAIETWRSHIEQDQAKAKGLSNASAGQSPHNCCKADGSPNSKAFDFAVFDHDASYVKDGTDHRYTLAGEIGEKLGLVWGGRWTLKKNGCNPDYDHLQLNNWKDNL